MSAASTLRSQGLPPQPVHNDSVCGRDIPGPLQRIAQLPSQGENGKPWASRTILGSAHVFVLHEYTPRVPLLGSGQVWITRPGFAVEAD